MPPTFRPHGARSTTERKREHDVRRRRAKPWRKWYGTATWQAIRQHQLASEPLCRLCAERNLVVPAIVVDHVGRHGGDWHKFVAGPFRSLCKPCHDGEVQREEHASRAGAALP